MSNKVAVSSQHPAQRAPGASSTSTQHSLTWLLVLAGIVALTVLGVIVGMQRPRDLAISSGSVGFDHASVNWNAAERAPDGTAFRWTGDVSTLTFRSARNVLPANRPVTLALNFAPRPNGSPISTVTLRVNGQIVDTWPSNVAHPVDVDVASLLRRDDALT